MLARELPKKRRPTEVSALIIGSAGAIGWHNSSLKVHLGLHCWVSSAPANRPRARSLVACVSKRFSQRERVPMNTENLTIHIKVKDYSTWRQAYDGNEKSRLSAGITNGRVFRNAQDQNDIVVLQ